MAVKEWVVQEPDEDAVKRLTAAGYSGILSRLLVNRGITDPGEAGAFLQGGPALHDPWLLKGMEQAVGRIRLAVGRGEKIVVYGDYDVDGVTATAVMLQALRACGAEAEPYIPSREGEGYGLNAAAVRAICTAGAGLIVTVDTGISAFEEALLIKTLGADLIITDHHEPRPELPAACAVVNPKQPGCAYPCRDLAGVGVAFKVACALLGDEEQAFEAYGGLVTLGTVADVVPLTGENRTIVKRGLTLMQRGGTGGVKSLLEAAGAGGAQLSATLLSFTAAPRVNAAGRMGSADDALRLLMARSDEEAAPLARALDELNRRRQETETGIFVEAVEKIRQQAVEDRVIMVAGEGWHCGVIGIVASRLAELYAKPAIVVSFEGDEGRASCRSFPGLDIHDALMHCSALLERFGGHQLAAGFTVRRENYDALYAAVQAYAAALAAEPAPSLTLECALPTRDVTLFSARECKKLEPCGCGNPEPLFLIRSARVRGVTPLKEGRHLRLELQKGELTFKAMAFNVSRLGTTVEKGDLLDLAASLDVNFYNHTESLTVIVRELKKLPPLEEGRRVYARLLRQPRGGLCRELMPGRAHFAAVYRALAALGGRAAPEQLLEAMPPDGPQAAQLLLILDVFEEMGLVARPRDDGADFEIVEHIHTRVDLGQSKLLRRLAGENEPAACAEQRTKE